MNILQLQVNNKIRGNCISLTMRSSLQNGSTLIREKLMSLLSISETVFEFLFSILSTKKIIFSGGILRQWNNFTVDFSAINDTK